MEANPSLIMQNLREKVQHLLHSNAGHGADLPIFENMIKLKPVVVNHPMDQVHIDLFDFNSMPSPSGGKEHTAMSSPLVFFFVLAPMEKRTAAEAASVPSRLQRMRSTFGSEGRHREVGNVE